MFSHRQIEAFRAVMQTGTMTDASRLLRTSQPSVSRLISDLERASGLALFERRHGRISATDEGLRLFDVIEESYVSLDTVVQAAADLREMRDAQITVAAMPALCLDVVPVAVARFLAGSEGARVSVQARSSRQVVNWMANREADIGLATPPYDLPGIRCDLAVSAPYVCAMSADHRLARLDRVEAADLADEPLITLTNSVTHDLLKEVFDERGIAFRPRVETPLSQVAARHAELGVGVAIVDPYSAAHPGGGSLVVRPFFPPVPFRFGVLVSDSRPRNAAVERFYAILVDALRSAALPSFVEADFGQAVRAG